jgi:hypothetical protein
MKASGSYKHHLPLREAPNSGEWLRAAGIAALILLICVVWTLST